MSSQPDHVAGEAAIMRQAAEWFSVISGEPSEKEQQAWQQWMATDPRHAAAWTRVETLSQRFTQLPGQVDRHAAVSALQALRRRRQTVKLLTVSGLGLLPAWLLVRNLPWQRWNADYSTAVGEQRSVVLADGTHAWLNTNSALRVQFDASARRITLLQGEVLIQTAADPQSPGRPFEVATEEGLIRPLGTRFDVYRRAQDCHVGVYEGEVEIRTSAGMNARLAAGYQSNFNAERIEAAQPAEAGREVWTRGILVADNQRLGDLMIELARYQSGYVSCDPAVADLRVVGSFPLADKEQIYQAIERSLPVRVHRPLPWYVSVEAR